ncbi:CBS domain-containing protein [Desulfopila inferna]|uniref:CBS domain-containing protein n=1 Tax=Desulfopila inferna TaxID=468528 RepID=UPI0019625D9A|nr:CBS domain-containing protein [Desulfopila inferna]MBM9602775.1 CBS domain-containing protein [Desulfopila inferna]
MKQAKDIMTTKVITVTPQTTVSELAQLLTENNISGAPVVDSNNTLIGVVTENDLVYQQKKVHIPTVINILDSVIYLESQEKMREEMQKITGVTVNEIYTKNVKTVNTSTLLEDIATIMAEKKIHTIPVVEGDQLVGVIGRRDIIKTLIS